MRKQPGPKLRALYVYLCFWIVCMHCICLYVHLHFFVYAWLNVQNQVVVVNCLISYHWSTAADSWNLPSTFPRNCSFAALQAPSVSLSLRTQKDQQTFRKNESANLQWNKRHILSQVPSATFLFFWKCDSQDLDLRSTLPPWSSPGRPDVVPVIHGSQKMVG